MDAVLTIVSVSVLVIPTPKRCASLEGFVTGSKVLKCVFIDSRSSAVITLQVRVYNVFNHVLDTNWNSSDSDSILVPSSNKNEINPISTKGLKSFSPCFKTLKITTGNGKYLTKSGEIFTIFFSIAFIIEPIRFIEIYYLLRNNANSPQKCRISVSSVNIVE